MSIRPTTSPALADQLKDPAYSAYVLLRTLFTVAPILFGLDKFFNLLTHPQHWNMYLAGWINDLVPGTADQCMYLVGAIEIVAGVLVAVAPRIGAWGSRGLAGRDHSQPGHRTRFLRHRAARLRFAGWRHRARPAGAGRAQRRHRAALTRAPAPHTARR